MTVKELLVKISADTSGFDRAVSGAASKTQELTQAKKELENREKSLAAELSKTNAQLQTQQTHMSSASASVGNMQGKMLKLGSLLHTLITSYEGKKIFNATIVDNAKMEQELTSFEVLLQGNVERAKQLMSELTDFAAKTPLTLPDTTKATKLLLGYGVQVDNVMTVLKRLGDLSQGNAEKLDRVSLAYGQMLAKGKVTGEELRQMVEAQVPLTQALADALGITTEKLSKMIEKGEVGIPTLNKAIENMTNEGGQFYNMMDKQSQTAAGLFSTLKDNLQKSARDIGSGAFEYLKIKMQELLAYLDKISKNGKLAEWGQRLGKTLETIFKLIAGLSEKLITLRGVVIMLAGAFAGLKVAQGVFAAMQTGQLILNTLSGALSSAAAAQTGLNAAMWANPAGIALGVISALAGAVAAYVIAYHNAKKSVEEYGQEIEELDKRESNVIQTYREYQSLMSKSNAFGLTAAEKERLVKVSKELVDTYGLECSGVDELTGAYQIGSEAMEKYMESARRKRNELLRGQSEERDKRIKKDIDELSNQYTSDKAQNILLSVKEQRNRLWKEYEGIKSFGNFYELNNNAVDDFLSHLMGSKYKNTEQGSYTYQALKSYIMSKDENEVLLDEAKGYLQQSESKYVGLMHDITNNFMDNIKAEVGDTLTENGENMLIDILTGYLQNAEIVDGGMLEMLQAETKSFSVKYGEIINTLSKDLQNDQTKMQSGSANLNDYDTAFDNLQRKAEILNQMVSENVISVQEGKRQTDAISTAIAENIGLSFAKISKGISDNDIKQKFEGMVSQFLSLENSIRTGSIDISEYMRQMADNISNVNLGNVFGDMDQEAGEFLGTLSSKLASVTADVINQFQSGTISCIEFGDAMANAANAQLAMTKKELDYAESRKQSMEAQSAGRDMTEEEKKTYDALCDSIAISSEKVREQEDSVGKSVAAWEEMRGLNTVFDENAEAMNKFSGYTQQQIQNLSGGTKTEFDTLVGQVTGAFSTMSGETQSAILATLSETTGMTISTSEQLNAALQNGQITLQDVMGASAKVMGDIMGQLGNDIADLMDAAGALISNFDYSITFHLEKIEGGEFNLVKALSTGFKEGISIPDLTWKVSGQGGKSVTDFANKLRQTASGIRNINISSMFSSMGSGVYGRGRTNNNSGSMGTYAEPEPSEKRNKSKSNKDNSDKEAEKARKARVDAYKSYIEENERLDERWNKQQQEYGNLNDEQWLYNLSQRAQRYRWYADDVLKQDYMTAEEKQELRQKYLEQAEDTDLEYYKYYKQMVEKAAKAEKEAYSGRLESSKDWIAREKALGRMSVDEEIAAGRRVQEYTLAAIRKVEENSEYSAEQKQDLIENMWKTYVDYANKEIDLERDKLDEIYEMNKENQERTAESIEKTHSDRERWVSLMTERDDMTTGEQIAAITKWLEGEEAEKTQIWDSYEQTISQIRQRRKDALDSGEFDENDDYIKGLDKQIADEEKKRDEAWAAAHQYYEDLETKRYQLYRDFLNQEVEDFVSAERKKVEAKYNAMEQMEAAEDRDKKRAELAEQIKQYEGAVTKDGKEKLKSLRDELDALNKEEVKAQREQKKEQELEDLDDLEKGLKEQVKLTARLSIDSEDVADQLSAIIDENDTLAKQWADKFTQPWSEYFGKVLPQQLHSALDLSDYAFSFDAGNYNNPTTPVTTIDRSRHIKQDINVNALNPSDVISTLYSSIGGFPG